MASLNTLEKNINAVETCRQNIITTINNTKSLQDIKTTTPLNDISKNIKEISTGSEYGITALGGAYLGKMKTSEITLEKGTYDIFVVGGGGGGNLSLKQYSKLQVAVGVGGRGAAVYAKLEVKASSITLCLSAGGGGQPTNNSTKAKLTSMMYTSTDHSAHQYVGGNGLSSCIAIKSGSTKTKLITAGGGTYTTKWAPIANKTGSGGKTSITSNKKTDKYSLTDIISYNGDAGWSTGELWDGNSIDKIYQELNFGSAGFGTYFSGSPRKYVVYAPGGGCVTISKRS